MEDGGPGRRGSPEASYTAAEVTGIIVRAVNRACRRHGLSALPGRGGSGDPDCFMLSVLATGQRFWFTLAEESRFPEGEAPGPDGPSGVPDHDEKS